MEPQLRILTSASFAPELAKVMSVPHTMLTLPDDPAGTRELLLETDVLVYPEFRPEWRSDGSKRLRLVHSTGAGVDGIDRASLPHGCMVCNVYGHERAVTETAFMHMLALQKSLLRVDSSLRRGTGPPT